ncbi:MAG: hypothetical protein JNL41_17605 [Phenylobacterium sp.]|uniref:S41 family peptidase n=1 Tax=Phenylobacterium sp. TaxID=1871053 RepID=UPI001A3779E1|nr:S41 family peptidase [Phenylobacterium sp.]MBL8556098.1 hypothetical protein [Phenylobacterium sp.]
MSKGLRAAAWLGIVAAVSAGAPAAEAQLGVQTRPELPEVSSAWRTLIDADLTFLAATIQRNYIYANYQAGPEWRTLFDGALSQARREARLVGDFGSYRAVIQHYLGAFQDPHLSGYFQAKPAAGRFPGFTMKYSGGHFVVDRTFRRDIASGAEIESCDGKPTAALIDEVSPFFGGPRGRDTTRATVAQQYLIDTANPLYALPKVCRVAGKDLTLTWSTPPDGVLDAVPARSGESPSTLRDETLAISDFGPNGAWVRVGTMYPVTQDQAAAFQALIDRAPSLRTRQVVVFDVRGNRGGNYNWFMGLLRGLYGQPYADHYARARLGIAPVIFTPPGERQDPSAGFAGEALTIKPPADPPLTLSAPKVSTLANGGTLMQMAAPLASITYPTAAPASLTKAKVYVLTDFGCASACISFVDEMMRFPGVTLVGAETHIDRRAGGFPLGYEAPSGLVVARMGRMTREGRARGENEAWAPGAENRYSGDIADTAAVKQWLTRSVLPRDRAAGAKWTQTATLKGPE